MIYVVNDMHGNKRIVNGVVSQMQGLHPDDTLIINGDGAGARGPIMNNLVKIFYEVRRKETPKQALLSAIQDIIGEKPKIPDSWIYETVHAGLFRKLMAEKYKAFNGVMEKEIFEALEVTIRPISEVARQRGARVVYLPGNGEIAPTDFSTEDFTKEVTVAPEQRLFNRIARGGYFEQFGIEYIFYATAIDDALLLSTHLLDLDPDAALEQLKAAEALNRTFRKVIVHYPLEIEEPRQYFNFWTPCKTDIQRSRAIQDIVKRLSLQKSEVYFGHIHLGGDDPRMNLYPLVKRFNTSNSTWVKPGIIIGI